MIKGPPTARESPIAKRSRSALDMYLLSMRFFNEKDRLTVQIEACQPPLRNTAQVSDASLLLPCTSTLRWSRENMCIDR